MNTLKNKFLLGRVGAFILQVRVARTLYDENGNAVVVYLPNEFCCI